MSSEQIELRLQDVIENIDRIASHLGDMNFEAFVRDTKTVDAVERCLQRITEAVIKIGPERMARVSPQTPPEAVRGLGNLLRHAYDEVDLTTIWTTIRESLPELRQDCLAAMNKGA